MTTRTSFVFVFVLLACEEQTTGSDPASGGSGGLSHSSSGGSGGASYTSTDNYGGGFTTPAEAGAAGSLCSKWKTEAECVEAGCRPIMGTKAVDPITLVFSDLVFFDCQVPGCTAAVTCAFPPGQSGDCYAFRDGCIPSDWTSTLTCSIPGCPHGEDGGT
jgi:hypothetical protein